MAFLMKARKTDLCQVAEEIGVELPDKCTVIEIGKLITGSENYDESMVKEIVERVICDRKEKEMKEDLRSQERLAREHEIKLKELELGQGSNNGNARLNSSMPEDRLLKYFNLVKEQLPRAPDKTENWVFFFHQIEMVFQVYSVPEEYWGKIILNKLGHLMRNLTNCLGLDKLSNYKEIKECILAENALTPLQHKKNFESCYKRFSENYVQWLARAKTNLDYYLESRGVENLQDLKDLILADKIKDSLNNTMKSHILVKEGIKWMKPKDLAKELDLYVEALPQGKGVVNSYRERADNRKDIYPERASSEKVGEKNSQVEGKGNVNLSTQSDRASKGDGWRDKPKVKCFICGQPHYRAQCPQKREISKEEKKVSCIRAKVGLSTLESKKHRINEGPDRDVLPVVDLNVAGQKIEAIRDSGAEISVFRKDLIPEKFITGGHVYLIPAMGEMQKADLVTLPIALWEDNQAISSEIDIVAAVMENLNSPALLTPADYDVLLKQAKLYSVTVGLVDSGRTGREENRSDTTQVQELEDNPQSQEKVSDQNGENSKDEGKSIENQFNLVEEVDSPEISKSEGLSVVREIAENTQSLESLSREDNEGNMGENKFITDQGSQSKLFRKQQRECPTLEKLWEEGKNRKNNYFVEDGLLYRKNLIVSESVKQLVVPKCKRKEILRLAHNQLTAGHLGSAKTLERIKLAFFWEGLRKEVKQYCEACEDCQLRRKIRVSDRSPIQPVARPELPFQVINADLIGPIEPSSARGHKFVLTIVDQHSRWPEAVPIRSLTAKAACQAFLQIFARMGVPQVLAFDNGKNFAAELTTEFLKHLGVAPRFSTPGYPLSNGLVERFNGSLKNMLHHAVRKHGKDWDLILPLLLWAIREVPNETTGISPFQLVYGRIPNGPLSIVKSGWEGEMVIPEGIGNSLTEYLERLKNSLKSAAEFASGVADKKQRDYANRYNLRSSKRKFSVGEKVIVLIPDSTNKLYSRWTGPGVIVDQKNEHSFLVELPDGSVRHLHQNKLRAYVHAVNTIGLVYEVDEEFGDIQHAPVGDNVGSDKEFEAILEEKLRHLEKEERKQLKEILMANKTFFVGEVKRAKVGSHVIRLKPEVERKQPHIYRVPEVLKPAVEQQIQELLEKGLIEPSHAEIAYPIVCVAKKDASIRLCVDYRGLNTATKTIPFPMQDATELRYKAGAAMYITTLDILKGYWTIPMEEESKELTSFIGPKGQYQWVVMPYGLSGSAGTFQKTMNRALVKHSEYAESYIDDIIVFSKTWEDHLKHLESVLGTLCELNFTANIKKCHFVANKVVYLGHIVGSGEHGPDPEKLKVIENLQRPKNKKELKSALGLFNYYREYVENFANIAIPLTALTKKNIPNEIPWSEREEDAFVNLKIKLCQAVALNTPDISKPFVIACDASEVGIGASLGQYGEGDKIMPITFASQKLSETQKRWSAVEREAFALIWALKKFETWIFGAKVYIYTDHNPLKYLTECAPRNAKLQRWLLALQRYDTVINYKPGSTNKDADALSRLIAE